MLIGSLIKASTTGELFGMTEFSIVAKALYELNKLILNHLIIVLFTSSILSADFLGLK